MRCYCCNNILTDYETSLRHAETLEYQDTCLKCLQDLNIPVFGNASIGDYQEEAEYLEYFPENNDDEEV